MAFLGRSDYSMSFTETELRDATRIGTEFHRKHTGHQLTKADYQRIERRVLLDFEGQSSTDSNRRRLSDVIMGELRVLFDAEQEIKHGAQPVMDGKLHPIEDEV